MAGSYDHSVHFHFEGIVAFGELEGLPVSGTIEALEDRTRFEGDPSKLWLAGILTSNEQKGKVPTEREPRISLSLRVAQDTFAELVRVFSSAFAGGGSLSLEVNVRHPRQNEPDFWKTTWRDEYLEIGEFYFRQSNQSHTKTKRRDKDMVFWGFLVIVLLLLPIRVCG